MGIVRHVPINDVKAVKDKATCTVLFVQYQSGSCIHDMCLKKIGLSTTTNDYPHSTSTQLHILRWNEDIEPRAVRAHKSFELAADRRIPLVANLLQIGGFRDVNRIQPDL